MDHTIQPRRSELDIINWKWKKKKNSHIMDFTDPADHRLKVENDENTWTLLEGWEGSEICNDSYKNSQEPGEKTRRTKEYCKNRNHPDHRTIKIVQDTQKSTGDLSRIVVTQTPTKNHQLELVWKPHME